MFALLLSPLCRLLFLKSSFNSEAPLWLGRSRSCLTLVVWTLPEPGALLLWLTQLLGSLPTEGLSASSVWRTGWIFRLLWEIINRIQWMLWSAGPLLVPRELALGEGRPFPSLLQSDQCGKYTWSISCQSPISPQWTTSSVIWKLITDYVPALLRNFFLSESKSFSRWFQYISKCVSLPIPF